MALAGYLIWRTLRDYSLAELMQALRAFPLDHLALSGMFAAGSYATLTLFDLLGTRYVGNRLAYPKVALASFRKACAPPPLTVDCCGVQP